jgi:hypothetical protein
MKKCYRRYRRFPSVRSRAIVGGKVVWLTDQQLTIEHLKCTDYIFVQVTDSHELYLFRKYMNQPIDNELD